ncbi:hypothetical protein [Paraburkholderia tropica]|uniref:hypothetical protein n=1 Tax=Paraburkholderia tropica TaxID=92647 RepID=UPI002ABDD218|nr:hypothetical protein [Paraburkholderia tropica]
MLSHRFSASCDGEGRIRGTPTDYFEIAENPVKSRGYETIPRMFHAQTRFAEGQSGFIRTKRHFPALKALKCNDVNVFRSYLNIYARITRGLTILAAYAMLVGMNRRQSPISLIIRTIPRMVG